MSIKYLRSAGNSNRRQSSNLGCARVYQITLSSPCSHATSPQRRSQQPRRSPLELQEDGGSALSRSSILIQRLGTIVTSNTSLHDSSSRTVPCTRPRAPANIFTGVAFPQAAPRQRVIIEHLPGHCKTRKVSMWTVNTHEYRLKGRRNRTR